MNVFHLNPCTFSSLFYNSFIINFNAVGLLLALFNYLSRIVTEMVLGQFTHMPTLAYHYGSNLQPLVIVVKKNTIDSLRYLHFHFIRKWFLTSLFCIIVQHDTHIWQGRPFSRRTRAITHRTCVPAQSQLILCSRLAFVRNQKCCVHWLHARWTNKAPH